MSYEKRYGMTSGLTTNIKDLHKLGYIVRHVGGIKPKHVQALVNHWKEKNLAVGTIKNRLAHLRIIGEIFKKRNLVRSNHYYNIGSRSYVATRNKAIFNADFSKIQDRHLKLSLELQQAFGLRREECMKIIPSLADKGNKLWLQDSWAKGKIERLVPIRTQEQRDVLNRAKNFVGRGKSLIPIHKKYIHQKHVYNRETREIGYKNPHGLRHAYAQIRYKELAGWECPINGGKTSKELTEEEKKSDLITRKIISRELGHSRVSVTKVYLG